EGMFLPFDQLRECKTGNIHFSILKNCKPLQCSQALTTCCFSALQSCFHSK
ncbi:hypothetical protein HN51_039369, partial [Arachis hypogaea]